MVHHCNSLLCKVYQVPYLRIAPLSKPEDKVKPGSRLLRPSKDNIILKSTLLLGYNTLFIHSIQQVIMFYLPPQQISLFPLTGSIPTHPGAPCLSLPALSGWSRWWCCCRVAALEWLMILTFNILTATLEWFWNSHHFLKSLKTWVDVEAQRGVDRLLCNLFFLVLFKKK